MNVNLQENLLWDALAEGNYELVQTYLASGWNIDRRNEKGWNAIIMATFNHQYRIVEMLLQNGADINSTNQHGTSVLMYAKTKVIVNRNFDFLQYLIDRGAKVNLIDKKNGYTVLDYVKVLGDIEMINFFKKNGAL